MTTESDRVRRRIGCTCLAPFVALVLGEIAARFWVSSKYTPERIEQLTTHAATRGRFASHPNLPFVLNPDFEGQNALGFRGGPVEAKKRPGAHRIVCIGASTTYGSLADPRDSYPAQLGELLRDRAGSWEVVNGGVLGWVSTEMWVNLGLRVLPLDPDIVVILPGRNEIFPQAYNGFRADYTHFRRPGFSFVVSNYAHKELFRWSRLLMLFCTVRGERFGWSETEEHPLYGGIVWENRPTVQEALRNIEDPARMETFRRSLEGMVEMCRARKIPVLMCTMQFRAELLDLQEFAHASELNPGLGGLIDRDNQLVRDVGGRFGVPIAETAKISERPELFLDDSHLTLEGHKLQAQIVYDGLVPLMDGL
jgi:hypothetical protein